jgi:ABC-type transport system substrate-binding protein
LAVPTGGFMSTLVDGSPAELDRRLPYDPAKAKALLAEAGYPNGFSVVLDCVNVAWREAVCQAMTAMLTQVGIRATLRSSPTNQFFPKLSQGTGSLVEFGWTPTTEAWGSLNALFRTWDKSGLGTFNAGRYSNPKLDTLIDAMRVEPDLTRTPRDGCDGAAFRRRRSANGAAVSPHADLGDEEERACHPVAERRRRAALAARAIDVSELTSTSIRLPP